MYTNCKIIKTFRRCIYFTQTTVGMEWAYVHCTYSIYICILPAYVYIYSIQILCTLYNTQVNPVCCLFYAHVQLYMYSTCTMYMYKCTNCTVCTVRVINCLYASFTNSNVIFCIYITYGNMLNVHRTMHFYIV